MKCSLLKEYFRTFLKLVREKQRHRYVCDITCTFLEVGRFTQSEYRSDPLIEHINNTEAFVQVDAYSERNSTILLVLHSRNPKILKNLTFGSFLP